MGSPKMDHPLVKAGKVRNDSKSYVIIFFRKRKKITKLYAYLRKGKKIISTSHQPETFMHFPGSRSSAHGAVTPEGKHCR